MKVLLRYLALVITLVLATAGVATAQEPVSTGIIQGIQPKEGTLTLRSDQTQNLTTFFGVDKANIQTTDGQVMTIDSLQLGTRVTVQYTQRGKQWFISKVILPAAAPALQSFPVNAEPSNSPNMVRANDNDRTTSADQKKTDGVQRVQVIR